MCSGCRELRKSCGTCVLACEQGRSPYRLDTPAEVSAPHLHLERNIFITDRRRGNSCRLGLRGALVEVVAGGGDSAGGLSAFAAPAEQHELISDDVGHVLLLVGLLVVPGVGTDAAFDVNLAALFKIFASDFG